MNKVREMHARKLHVKKGDEVLIISGKDKGKKGKVLECSSKEGKVIVEGRNIVSKHVKPKKAGQLGGIVQAESAMYSSKVMPICPKCNKPTRVGHDFKNDEKVRICKKCNAAL
ncbi:MAG: 50S ribosomal protein L24 [Oscillospiraceae bacterium]|nr:50S ribosomal protein L24 [Oscillospiraceae bacterium]